jgi:hypothetical protein
MNRTEWSEYEAELILYLAKYYDEEGEIIGYREFLRFNEFGWDKTQRIANRLKHFRLITGYSSDSAKILPAIIDAARQVQNPPPKDHWRDCVRRFRSTRWSVAVLLLSVVLSVLIALMTLMTMFKTLFDW